ncbi:MAG: hypothetical protein BEN19_04650 [Epulopiscium sp. Nuni2H_MBin003]|nr:MAG: hypothetical protein BEN19_04650 [Epulopiscium sp. Nuni2H_MBin003]
MKRTKFMLVVLALAVTAPVIYIPNPTYATQLTVATQDNLSMYLDQILDNYSKTPEGAANAVNSLLSYKYMQSVGDTKADAIYAINNRRVACYQFAGLFCELMNNLGYEAKRIVGTGRLGSEHSWVAVKFSDGYWYYYDPQYSNNSYTEEDLNNLNMRWDKTFTVQPINYLAQSDIAYPLKAIDMNIKVDDVDKTIEIISIDNINYTPLEDLARILETTNNAFSISVSPENSAIEIFTNNPTPFDFTTEILDSPLLDVQTIYKDGIAIELQSHMRNNTHYFKLTDITDLLGISVEWNPEEGTMLHTALNIYDEIDPALQEATIEGFAKIKVEYQSK